MQGTQAPTYILLYSGGLDSTYLLYKLLSRGRRVIAFHALTSRDTLKVALGNAMWVAEKTRRGFKLVVSEHHRVLMQAIRALAKLKAREFTCIACKLLMLMEARMYAEESGLRNWRIVTGESLGQVASQTLPNMMLIHVLSRVPVITPLLGVDKHEASNLIAHEVLKAPECRFLPRRVVTREDPVLSKMLLDMLRLEELAKSIIFHEVLITP